LTSPVPSAMRSRLRRVIDLKLADISRRLLVRMDKLPFKSILNAFAARVVSAISCLFTSLFFLISSRFTLKWSSSSSALGSTALSEALLAFSGVPSKPFLSSFYIFANSMKRLSFAFPLREKRLLDPACSHTFCHKTATAELVVY
jgi:hypothetical protein